MLKENRKQLIRWGCRYSTRFTFDHIKNKHFEDWFLSCASWREPFRAYTFVQTDIYSHFLQSVIEAWNAQDDCWYKIIGVWDIDAWCYKFIVLDMNSHENMYENLQIDKTVDEAKEETLYWVMNNIKETE
jgi:hypothetical protein